MVMGIVAFYFVVQSLGGLEQAGKVPMRITESGDLVQDYRFDSATRSLAKHEQSKKVGRVLDGHSSELTDRHPYLGRDPIVAEFKKKDPKSGEFVSFRRELGMPLITFVTYLFIP